MSTERGSQQIHLESRGQGRLEPERVPRVQESCHRLRYASGTLAEDAIDLEVFKPGFHPPADAVPSALGGEHCLGIWAELCGIAGVWNYAMCLNRDLNPLRLPSDGWDSPSNVHRKSGHREWW
jgi:hypothetical protein